MRRCVACQMLIITKKSLIALIFVEQQTAKGGKLMTTVMAAAHGGIILRLWIKGFGRFWVHEFKKQPHHHRNDQDI